MTSGFGAADVEYLLESVLLPPYGSGMRGFVSIELWRRSSVGGGEVFVAMAWYLLAMFDTLTGRRGVSRVGN